jgi:hypothetical protein
VECGHGRSGDFPPIVTALTGDKAEYIDGLKRRFSIESKSFDHDFDWAMWYDAFDGLDNAVDDDTSETADILRQIKQEIDDGKTPFETLDQCITALHRSDLEPGFLYFYWEDDYIELYDNVAEFGEPAGTWDSFSEEDWKEILSDLERYRVKPEE